jgi:hypothetical protein
VRQNLSKDWFKWKMMIHCSTFSHKTFRMKMEKSTISNPNFQLLSLRQVSRVWLRWPQYQSQKERSFWDSQI